jgi:hypothetical protein
MLLSAQMTKLSLPIELASRFQALLKNGTWTDSPRIVTLGVEGNYLLLTNGNVCYWNMPKYAEIASQIPEMAKNGGLANITVSIRDPAVVPAMKRKPISGCRFHNS